MKKAKGLVFFVIALLILGLAYTAFFGVYTWYGATENTVIRGTKSLLTGIDLGKTAQVVLTPDEGSEVTAESLETAKDIIESRLSVSQYNSVEVSIDYTGNKILITLPLSESYKLYQIQALLEDVRGKGVLTFRKGDEADSNGVPTGEVILTNDKVAGAVTGRTTDTNAPAVQVHLTTEGSSVLSSATYTMNGDVLSIWMDNTLLNAYTIDSAITSGSMVISYSNLTMDTAGVMAYKINLGPMPFGFTYSDIIEFSGVSNGALQDILMYVGIAFAAVCLLLIIYYRLSGVVITLAVMLEAALSVILFTRYFPAFKVATVTVPAILAIALLGLVTIALGIWQAERIKANFKDGSAYSTAIKGGLTGMSAAAVDGFIIAGITAFSALAAYGSSSYRLAWFRDILNWMGVNPGGYTVYPFVYALLYGLILAALVVLLLQRVMMSSLSGINAFKKPFLFGGK